MMPESLLSFSFTLCRIMCKYSISFALLSFALFVGIGCGGSGKTSSATPVPISSIKTVLIAPISTNATPTGGYYHSFTPELIAALGVRYPFTLLRPSQDLVIQAVQNPNTPTEEMAVTYGREAKAEAVVYTTLGYIFLTRRVIVTIKLISSVDGAELLSVEGFKFQASEELKVNLDKQLSIDAINSAAAEFQKRLGTSN
jgi:hypothetical protein